MITAVLTVRAVEETCGCEGFEVLVGPDAQASEQAEGDVMGDETFEIASDTASKAEEADTDDGDIQGCNGWVTSGHGDEVGRSTHEANATGDCCYTEQRGKDDPTLVGLGEFR